MDLLPNLEGLKSISISVAGTNAHALMGPKNPFHLNGGISRVDQERLKSKCKMLKHVHQNL
jgi:hypothetical protein